MNVRSPSNALYSSDRNFKVWSYRVSFRSLLLRSNKGDSIEPNPSYATRAEILFTGVAFMHLQHWLQGVTIDECDAAGVPGHLPRGVADAQWFRILSGDSSFFVAARTMAVREDSLEYGDPTPFLDNFGLG
jgi:hypothetical protein